MIKSVVFKKFVAIIVPSLLVELSFRFSYSTSVTPTDSLVDVSSDLSQLRQCNRVDRHTAQAIVTLDAESIGPGQAYGFLAIRGLIHTARYLSWTARLLTLQNSGDTSRDQSRVVG